MFFLPENLRERRLSGFASKARYTVQALQNVDFVAGCVFAACGAGLFAVGDTAISLYRARTQQNKGVLLGLNAALAF